MIDRTQARRWVAGGGYALRVLACALGLLATLGGRAPVQAQSGTSTNELLPAGSLVIPMDNNKQNIGALFNLKAYGLAITLLDNNIPVKWVISDSKGQDGTDFVANAARVYPSATSSATLDFAGGPFVIHAAYANKARPIIQAFGGNVAVYTLSQETWMPVRYNLLFKPRPLINQKNAAIATSTLVAAGVPAGDYAVTSNYTLDPTLFQCHTIILEPHNADTTLVSIGNIQAFLAQGGNFYGQCETTINFDIAASRTTTQFLSTGGLAENNVSTAATYLAPASPFSQFVGTINPATGGSVEDFKLMTGSSWMPGTEWQLQTGSDLYMAALRDIYPGSEGGIVFYLGGHDYSGTTVNELNGRRMMLNAIMVPTALISCPFEDLVLKRPELSITKSSPAYFTGTTGTYSFAISNSGLAANPDTLVVTDTLPVGLSYASGSGTGWTFSYNAGTRVLTARYGGTLAPLGGSTSFSITVNITAAAIGTAINRVWLAPQDEDNTANNTSQVSTNIPSVYGRVFEDFDQDGIQDPDEIGLQGVTVRITSSGTVIDVVTDANGDWLAIGVPPGTAVVDVQESFPTGVFHTNPPAGDPAANLDPNTITAPTNTSLNAGIDGYAGFKADLSMVKSVIGNVTSALVGDTITYVLTTTNAGTSPATLVVVRDTLPAGATLLYASRTGALTGNVITWPTIASLAVGGVVKDTVRIQAPSATGTMTNVAAVTGRREDTDLANNKSTVSITLTQPDLAIVKTHVGDFSVGANGTYTITVANNGTGPALPPTVVTDTLPAGLTFVSAAGIIGGWTFSNSGQVVTATLPTAIAAGASASFSITVTPGGTAVPQIVNRAWAAGQREANTGNNGATDTTRVRVADLTVVKRSDASFTEGVNGTYTVVIRNIGDGPSVGTITVVDTLKAGLSFVSGAGVIGTWSVAAVGQVVTATSSSVIAANDSAKFTITVLPGATAVPSVTNSAWASGGGEVNTGNNGGSVTTPVTGVPDLTLTKTSSSFTYGSNGTYTFTVNNIGGAATTGNIVVVDTLPTGIKYVSATLATGWAFTASADSTIVTATYSGTPLPAISGSTSFTITVRVFSTAASVTNSTRVTGGGETNTGNSGGSVTTPVTAQPDLAIVKTGPAQLVTGTTAVFTITVTNVGAATTSGTISVADTLPASLAYSSKADGTFSSTTRSGQVVTGTYTGTLAPGASIYFTITVNVQSSAVPNATNRAWVSGGGDVYAGNNMSSITIPAVASGSPADLTVTKTSSSFSAGQTSGASYTITVRNSGGSNTSATTTVTDTLPAGVTYVSGSGTGWTVSGSQLSGGRWLVTATSTQVVAPGANFNALTLNVTIAAGAAASVTNTVWVSGGGQQNNTGNDSGSVTTPVERGDLTIAKTSSTFAYLQTNATYTLTVTNSGAGTSYGTVTVVDTLPAGITYGSAAGTGWTVTTAQSGGRTIVTATSSQVVAPGANFNNIVLTVTVDASAVSPVTNRVWVSGGNETNTSNNSGSITTPITGADLAITKSTSLGLFIPGQPANYTFTISNPGSSKWTAVISLTDTLPTGLVLSPAPTIANWTITSTLLTTGPAAGRYVVAASTTLDVDIGASISFTINPTVNSSAIPSAYNKAYLTTAGQGNTANDTSSVATPVAAPDVTVIKTAATTFYVGGTATYRIVVRNVGTAPTSGNITVTDVLASGLTYSSFSGTGWAASAAGQTVTATYSGTALAANDSTVLLLNVSVAAGAAPSVNNTASVSGGGDVNTGNNSSTITTPVGAQPDLTLSKTSGTFTLGSTGTYTVTVNNIGSAASSGTITVTDTLPAGLTYSSGSGSGWSFTPSAGGTVVTATSSTAIPAGGSSSFTLQVNVLAAAVPSVSNTARVAGGGETNTTNNSSTAGTTVLAPDLTIEKTAGSLQAGQQGSYTLTVTNSGTSPTTAPITVTDTLPATLAFVSGTGTGWTGIGAAGQVVTATYNGTLAVGGTASVTINVMVNATSGASVTNVAWSGGGGQVKTNNDADTATVTVGGAPDLTIAKIASTMVKGLTGTYTLTVTNSGNATTTAGITVTDALPTGVKFVSGTGTGWSFSASPDSMNVTATYAGPALAPGATTQLVLTVAVRADAGTVLTNTANVSGGGETNTGNNGSGPVDATVIAPDLTIVKTAGTLLTGQPGTYNITVTNSGTAATTGTITVTDVLPSGLSYLTSTATGWTISAVGQTVTATYEGTLAPSATASFTLNVIVTAAYQSTVVNTATVSGGNDGNTTNNSSTSTATVGGAPDLTVSKAAGTLTTGLPATYTITVNNIGSAPSSGTITVLDTLPAGLSYTGSSNGGWTLSFSNGVLTATYPDPIAAGGSAAFTVSVDVTAASGSSVTNHAHVSGGGETNTSNNEGTSTATVGGVPNLQVTKTVSQLINGQGGTYTLTALNVGTAATTAPVVVLDTLPAGVAYATSTAPGWTVGVNGQVITATYAGQMAAGASASFSITVNVTAAAGTEIVNYAFVSGGGETETTDNMAGPVSAVVAVPDLIIHKTATTAFTVGQNATYRITVKNSGTAATYGDIVVSDVLPAGLTYVASSGAGWAVDTAGGVVTGTYSRNNGALAPNDSVSFTIQVLVGAAAYPSVTNTANVSGGTEVNTSNNSSGPITTPVTAPDLTVAKTAVGAFNVGATGTYQITIANSGNAPTSGDITVVDTLRSGLAYVPASGVGTGWTVTESSGVITAVYSGTAIAVGGTRSFTFQVSITGAAYPSVENAAFVSGGGEVNTSNNGTGTIATDVGAPDLTISKTAGTLLTGENGSYTIAVTNSGTGPTYATITVSDELPTGLTWQSGSGTGWTVGAVGQVVTATYAGVLAADATATFTINVHVDAAYGTQLSNTATVEGGGELPGQTGNNSDTEPATVGGTPDLTISKTAGTLVSGQLGEYTIVVTNAGTGPTSGLITVTDTLPASLAWSAGAGTGWTIGATGQVVTATYSLSIAAGGSASFTLTLMVSAASGETVDNTVRVAGGGETNTSNNSDTESATVGGQPNMTVAKTVSPSGTVLPGQVLTYTITFQNNGTGDAVSVLVTDELPPELQFKLGSIAVLFPGAISAAVEYYDGSAWSTTPVDGGCGAPAGFDGCVTRIRWTLSAALPASSQGVVIFDARVK